MARQITLNKLGGKAPFADSGLRLSKSIRIDEIEMHKDFQALFPIKQEVLNHIADSMKEKGFKGNHPVDIWFQTDEEGKLHKYLMDGYTRIKAAQMAGLETVPYYEFQFETFDEALKEALREQVDRRNLEGADLLSAVAKLYGTDFIQNTEGKKSEAIADVLGVSARTAEKAISVIKDADEEVLQQIENNELTVNKAYEKKHPKKAKTNTEVETETVSVSEDVTETEDLTDLPDDTEGIPKAVTVRSRDMSVQKAEHVEQSQFDSRLIERYKEGFVEGFKQAYSEAAYSVYEKVMELFHSGKNIEEIEADESFADFTFCRIAPKFDIPTESEEILKQFNK